jgi:putative restriction endonuclease
LHQPELGYSIAGGYRPSQGEVVERLPGALTLRDIEALSYYSIKFARLRVDRAHGIAPHKPILLLSVIELIRVGSIKENKIFLLPELNDTFLMYWNYLGSNSHNPDISRPFFHLRGDKFWHLIPNPGFHQIISSKVKLKNFAEVKRAVKYAYMDDILFELLQNIVSRGSLVTILTQKWFRHKSEQVEKLIPFNKVQ